MLTPQAGLPPSLSLHPAEGGDDSQGQMINVQITMSLTEAPRREGGVERSGHGGEHLAVTPRRPGGPLGGRGT